MPASGSSVKFLATRDSCGVIAPRGMTSSWPGYCTFLWYVVKPNRRMQNKNQRNETDKTIQSKSRNIPIRGTGQQRRHPVNEMVLR